MNYEIPPPANLKPIGQIVPRHAREIEASNWSVGAETMDRDYTVYKNWRTYLGPLGVKSVRIQSGWARTETEPGVYDWRWLDEIIPDMADQGVRPWVCLSYGNPLYPEGGSAAHNSPAPKGEALKAWDAFVRSFVERYGEYVNEWEIWNEPFFSNRVSFPDYVDLAIRTGGVIRASQPGAKIFVGSHTIHDLSRAPELLRRIAEAGKLDLVDTVTYHPYAFNPDDVFAGVGELCREIAEISPRISLFQGECGCPSGLATYGALGGEGDGAADVPWSEVIQAKWLLRRMLGDLGHGIRTSYFGIVDMHYVVNGEKRLNTKGLIAMHDDKTVDHPKLAYRALQHLTSVFDHRLQPVPDLPVTVTSDGCESRELSAYVYRRTDGQGRVAALWRRGPVNPELTLANFSAVRPKGVGVKVSEGTPTNAFSTAGCDVTLTGADFDDPVYVDMLTGTVYALEPASFRRTDHGTVFRNIPVGDWPVLIAERVSFAWDRTSEK
jgi:hypothetical protein